MSLDTPATYASATVLPPSLEVIPAWAEPMSSAYVHQIFVLYMVAGATGHNGLNAAKHVAWAVRIVRVAVTTQCPAVVETIAMDRRQTANCAR